MFGEGISRTGELLDMAVELNLVRKSGSWFSYGDDRMGQGREQAREYLAENVDVQNQIERSILIEEGILPPEADTGLPVAEA